MSRDLIENTRLANSHTGNAVGIDREVWYNSVSGNGRNLDIQSSVTTIR